jgi:hypothetical protein
MSSVANRVDDDELQRFYRSDRAFAKICDYLAGRERNSTESTVDRLSQVTDLSRADVIAVLRVLASMGLGEFVIGRRGQKSRLEWKVGCVSVARVARGEATNIVATEDIAVAEKESAGKGGAHETLIHIFRLRPDFPVEMELPANLTASEAQRLADFVRTLPFTT